MKKCSRISQIGDGSDAARNRSPRVNFAFPVFRSEHGSETEGSKPHLGKLSGQAGVMQRCTYRRNHGAERDGASCDLGTAVHDSECDRRLRELREDRRSRSSKMARLFRGRRFRSQASDHSLVYLVIASPSGVASLSSGS